MKLPTSLEELTPGWLEFALSSSFGPVEVRSLNVGKVIHGSATKARLDIEYGESTSQLPRSMWFKIGLEPHSAEINEFGFYDVEVECYQKLLPQFDIGSPQCYFSAIEKHPSQAALLLEDVNLRPARCCIATTPLAVDQAKAGVATLARIHGQSWGSPVMAANGLKPALRWGEESILQSWVDTAEELLARPRGFAIPLSLHKVDRIAAAYQSYRDLIVSGPTCLLHGDTHVGNAFVEDSGNVGFLDWQVASIGHWIHDVAYFIVTALDIPVRRVSDRALLEHYVDELNRHCPSANLTIDEAWDAYRKALIFGLVMWIGNPDEMQPPQVNTVCLARAGAAFDELDGFGAHGV